MIIFRERSSSDLKCWASNKPESKCLYNTMYIVSSTNWSKRSQSTFKSYKGISWEWSFFDLNSYKWS